MRATLFFVALCVVASTASAQLQWSLENVSTNGGGLVVGEVSGTALVSDGTALYLLKKDAGRIYTSVTGASGTWSLLTTTPGGPASDNGSLAYWNGKLVTRRDNQSGQECDRSYVLYAYDLSAHTWSQRDARGFGDHSYVAVGDHLYGMIHAAGSNQGGPFARVNLAAGGLDAFACNRFHVDGQLVGADSTWFSRGAQITALGTTLYGFKNDWRTNPAGDGDRLFAINTASVVDYTWGGDPADPPCDPGDFPNGRIWENWQGSGATPATDLGNLPVEPGYGGAIVGIPAGQWSSLLGSGGGLFILYGRHTDNPNHEAFGGPGYLYGLYSLSTGSFVIPAGALPGFSGSGLAATFHDGKVCIKRGAANPADPDDGVNAHVWIVAPAGTDVCDAPTAAMHVSSQQNFGGPLTESVSMAPADCNAAAGGATPLVRSLADGATYAITAEESLDYRFVRWEVTVDGETTVYADYAETIPVGNVTTNGVYVDVYATAYYDERCAPGNRITAYLESEPSGLAVAFDPADCTGSASLVTPGSASFGLGLTVTISAPELPGYNFIRWKDPGNQTLGTSRHLAWEATSVLAATAVYEPNPDDGCVNVTTAATPVNGSFQTSLAALGSDLYFYIQSGGQLYKSSDGGDTWTTLTTAPGGDEGSWQVASFAAAPQLGAQGSLIAYRNVGGTYGLVVYDVAGGTWSTHGNNWFGNTGYTVVGNKLYGNAHANMGNLGGNLTVADLTDLDATYCKRAWYQPSILGQDSNWYSRAVQFTNLGGTLYGFKSDWSRDAATPYKGTGDRLHRVNPAALVLNTFDGSSWTSSTSPATDLGNMPLEAGWGSVIVALPANWGCIVGSQGGLFILFGREKAGGEGWGVQGNKYAVYDVASGQYQLGLLPDWSGSGQSATYLPKDANGDPLPGGAVYIKQGGADPANPDSGFTQTIWIMSPSAIDPCVSPYTVNVTSTLPGVAIDVQNSDCNGDTDGVTNFQRFYGPDAAVFLTAPSSSGGFPFVEWQVAGASATTETTLPLKVTADGIEARAVYQDPCVTNPVTVNLSAVNAGGPVTITYSPDDCAGNPQTTINPTGVITVGGNQPVAFIAGGAPGKVFERWVVNGADDTTDKLLVRTFTTTTSLAVRYVDAPADVEDPAMCVRFSLDVQTPQPGEFATSLAVDSAGGRLFYMRKDSGRIFRSGDAGATWHWMTTAPGSGGAASSGHLAYYEAGAEGTLLTYRSDGSYDLVYSYDIGADVWTARGNRAVGGSGFVVVGDYLYANAHAVGPNQGGSITRVDLLQTDPWTCQRSTIHEYISGRDPWWQNRSTTFAAVGSKIYGYKNDSSDPAGDPDESGDRLWMFDVINYVPNFWAGQPGDPLHLNWPDPASATFATDLGALPVVNPGYGGAIVALPAYWNCHVGKKGGLFWLHGEANANLEGWGNPGIGYSIYDIAGGIWATGTLPAYSSAGASAVFHDGKVFIKQGASDPVDPNGGQTMNLWVVEPSLPFDCADVRQDADKDGDVDLVDFGIFAECYGAYDPSEVACFCLDANEDDLVDTFDYIAFESCLAGPGQTPACR